MEVVPTEEQVELLMNIMWRADARAQIQDLMLRDRDPCFSTEELAAEDDMASGLLSKSAAGPRARGRVDAADPGGVGESAKGC